MDPLADFDQKVEAGLRLLQFSEVDPPIWVTEEERFNRRKARGHFFDVTDTFHLEQELQPQLMEAADEDVTYPTTFDVTTIENCCANLSGTEMTAHVENLARLHNRYYQSNTGKEASDLIYDTLLQYAQGKPSVTVTKFSHSWLQYSIIARIKGSSDEPIVILGAHLDSINSKSYPPNDSRAPGADDNATGVSNLIDVFHALISMDVKLKRDVEFHFYAAEEVGLLGSQAIASNYRSTGRRVYGMLNLDMSGYVKPETQATIALITDYTNPNLTSIVRELIKKFSELPPTDILCHYACSDHASWNKNKYPSAFIFESRFEDHNPNIHTDGDTTEVQGFSEQHMREFAKVALAFAIHLGAE